MKLNRIALLIIAATVACADTREQEPAPAAAAVKASPFVGSYTGAWVAENDTTDFGTANWTIDNAGNVTGTDNEMKTGATVNVAGSIDVQGQFKSTLTPAGKTATTQLEGALSLDAQNQLTGTLHWSGPPITSYRYTLTRR